MKAARLAAAGAAALGWACSAGPADIARAPRAVASQGLTPGAVDAATLPAVDPSRVELAPPGPTSLPISIVLPVWGDDTAVFVSQFAGDRCGFIERVDGAKNALGPIIEVCDELVFAAFARDAELALASTRRGKICITRYKGSEETARTCEATWGTTLSPLAQGYMILGTKPFDPDAEPRPKKPGDTKKPSEKKTPKPEGKKADPKPNKKAGKKPASKSKSKPEPKVAADPRKLTIDRQLLSLEGALDGEAEPTGLVFNAPMAGLDLASAAAYGDRVRALFYEWAGPGRTKGSTAAPQAVIIGRARLAMGSIDATGTFDETSKTELPESDLMFGYLYDRQDGRLLSTRRGSLFIGMSSPRGHCEVRVVSPFSMPLITDDDLCAFDPARFFDVAEAVRAAQKANTPVGRTGFAAPPAASKSLAHARRAFGQPDYEPVRAAGWSERGYTLTDDGVFTFTSASEPTPLALPLVAQRSRIAGSAFALDGSGVASTDRGWVKVDSSGGASLDAHDSSDDPVLVRTDLRDASRRAAVKIGASFWQARGDLRPVGGASSSVIRPLPFDTAVAVGGREAGFIVELASGKLVLSRFDGKSAPTPIGSVRSPIGFGLDAVERRGGGVIIAGASHKNDGSVSAMIVDSSGKASTAIATGLDRAGGDPRVRLTALPGGGALLMDFERRHVVWLDDDAHPLAKADWVEKSSPTRCLDGSPAPDTVPSVEPGVFREVPQLAKPGTCLIGDVAWASDTSLRFFAETVAGANIRAELGKLEVPPAKPLPPLAPRSEPLTALDPPSRITCPADMVSIGGRFCVDRFEGSLADNDTGELVSADVAATPNFLNAAIGEWSTRRERVGDLFARALPLPYVDPKTFARTLSPRAINRYGIRPSGYVTGLVAAQACTAAQKRLCSLDEWKTACRGESDTLFPYGADYVDGLCNVNREAHPAGLLHGHSSLGHLDPRLNYATANGVPLAQVTGASPRCVSHWGDDGVYDMVGNLDEWVDEGNGAFAGGFYSRGSKSGCGALVDNHPASYLDYSTGVRCCKDASP